MRAVGYRATGGSPRSGQPSDTLGVRGATSYKTYTVKPQPNKVAAARGPKSGDVLDLYVAVATLRAEKHLTRFWSKVTKLNGENACWVWTSARNAQGYGQFYVGACKRCIPAHRISYALAGGDVGPGISVCHRCDNPICVRPDHLFAATHADNLRDMHRKGRGHNPKGRLALRKQRGVA